MPNPSEADRCSTPTCGWAEEIRHGEILYKLKRRFNPPDTEPGLQVGSPFGAGGDGRLRADPGRGATIYYPTGASTERQAVLAYNALPANWTKMGEQAVRETIINPIKRQEPGHFAFYRMSAEKILTDGTLRPWQLWLARRLRTMSYEMVGENHKPQYIAQMGEVMVELGFGDQLEMFAKEIGRLEAQLLWAQHQGMDFPPYVIAAMRDAVSMYRERGSFLANL